MSFRYSNDRNYCLKQGNSYFIMKEVFLELSHLFTTWALLFKNCVIKEKNYQKKNI